MSSFIVFQGMVSGLNSTLDPFTLSPGDAIGMGLNLNIRRVIFTSMHKYDGEVT